jgi:hypothetical protein
MFRFDDSEMEKWIIEGKGGLSGEPGGVSFEEKSDQPIRHDLKPVFVAWEHSQFESLPYDPCDKTLKLPPVNLGHAEHKP